MQRRLEASRDGLARHGVLYPRTARRVPKGLGRNDVDTGHGLLAEALRLADDRRFNELWASLQKEIGQAGARHVILSSELFCAPASEAFTGRLRRALENTSTRIIVYLRRPDQWAESIYREHLVARARRERRPFAVYLTEESERHFDFERRLAVWEIAFGVSSMRVRFYDDMLADGVDPAEDLMSIVCPEATQALAAKSSGRVHASLNRAYVDLVRAVNEIEGLDKVERGEIIGRLMTRLPAGRDKATLFTPEIHADFVSKWSPAVSRLADRFGARAGSKFRLDSDPLNRPQAAPYPDFETARAICASMLAPGEYRRR